MFISLFQSCLNEIVRSDSTKHVSLSLNISDDYSDTRDEIRKKITGRRDVYISMHVKSFIGRPRICKLRSLKQNVKLREIGC